MTNLKHSSASSRAFNLFMAICLAVTMSPTLKVNSAYADDASGAAKMVAAASSDVKAPEGGITKNANHEIKTFEIELFSGAAENAQGDYVWTPSTSAADHRFSFRVNYAVSGLQELPAGAITMRIPAQLLLNRAREHDDYFEMSLPREDEAEPDAKYVYRIVEEDPDGSGPLEPVEYIEVYNVKEIPAGDNGYFEVAYLTKDQTFEYLDYDPANPAASASDAFTATMAVKSGSDTLQAVSDEIPVYIDTHAEIASTEKRFPNLYRQWNPSWGEEPAPGAGHTADEYNYLIWEIRTDVGYPTQPYSFSLEDVIVPGETTSEIEAELVGYRLQGESKFTGKSSVQNQRLSGKRYDFVLTRHLKTDFFHDAEYVYKIQNRIDAKVDPSDQVDPDTKAASSKRYEWKYPQTFVPTGHFNTWKWGNNNWIYRYYTYWDIANYDLREMQEGRVESLDGFKYVVEAAAYPYPWTLEEGADPQDPASYGKAPMNYSIVDSDLWFFDQQKQLQDANRELEDYEYGDESKLTADDYQFDYLTYRLNASTATYDDVDKKFVETRLSSFSDSDVLVFYAKFGEGDEWHQVATHNLGTNEASFDEAYIKSMSTNALRIDFKDGCTAWRIDTTNAYYYSLLTVTPYVRLKASDFIKSHIFEESDGVTPKDIIGLRNTETFTVTDAKDQDVFEETSEAIDFARKNIRDSEIKKRVVATGNNAVKRNYTVTWKVEMAEQVTSNTGDKQYVRQDSGTFYDLLPQGSNIDLNSIQIESEEGYLSESAYDAHVVDNYKGSGRTLLVVEVKEQGQYYNLYYNTAHSWDSIKDYGTDVLNPVAYETGNDSIANGYPDNGGRAVLDDGDTGNDHNALSPDNAALFDDLDSASAAPRFIYDEEPHDIEAITAATAGLQKKVKADVDRDYSYETFIGPGESYAYRLRYASDNTTQAKNLILFDSLENFTTQDGAQSEWRGTLEQVDISQLEAKGIAPVVYLSAVEGLDLDDPANSDVSNSSVWTPESEFGDISNAKAVAIDLRKTTDGSDFVLGKGESVTSVLYMRAPEGLPVPITDHYAQTYNNVYIQDTIIDANGGTKDYFIHQDYTTVKYHQTAKIEVLKISAEDPDQKVPGITFRLYGTSDYGSRVDSRATSDRSGVAIFKDVETGSYKLLEYEGTPDWLEDHTEHDVVVDEYGNVTIDGEDVTSAQFVVENTPRIHVDVKFLKRDSVDTAKPVVGARFKLSGTSDYGNEIVRYANSDGMGRVEFGNIEMGSYQLREVAVPEGYVDNTSTYTVVVDETGGFSIAGESGAAINWIQGDAVKVGTSYVDNKGNSLLFNEPLHSFTIYKTGPKTMSYKPLQGCEFSLKGTSERGTVVDMVATSGNIGNVEFANLEPGAYVLKETKASEGYELDETPRAVVITADGKVTIDGLTKNDDGSFTWINKKQRDGKIVVTKVWHDSASNDERPTPAITLSTDTRYASASMPYFGPASLFSSSFNGSSYNRINSFSRNTSLTEDQVKAKRGVRRIDSNASDPNAPARIYGWIENQRFYWWSNAPYAKVNNDSHKLFKNLYQCSSIDVSYIDTSELTDMSEYFYSCYNVESLDLSTFNTSNVTTMYNMFSQDSRLQSVNLTTFDTSNVTDVRFMFNSCRSLEYVDLSSFDVRNLQRIDGMFYYCTSLKELDLSNFEPRTNCLQSLFCHCEQLKVIDISTFTTGHDSYGTGPSDSKGIYQTFSECHNLETIYVSDRWQWEFNDTRWNYVFSNSTNLVGGNGTHYRGGWDWEDSGKAYIDGPEHQGYFTYKEAEPRQPVVKPVKPMYVPVPLPEDDDEVITYLSTDDESEWVKSGDVWTYTFYVENEDLDYYTWEDPIEEYTGSNLEWSPAHVVNGAATIENTREGTPVPPTPQTSSLTISKSLASNVETGTTTVTKVSHTANLDDDGTKLENYANRAGNDYIRGSDRTEASNDSHVVTIPGAESLTVTITYGGESSYYDYMCMWAGAHPDYSVQSGTIPSLTGRLGGGNHLNPGNTKTYEVPGDSVTFSFFTNYTGCGDGYGYYAVVTGDLPSFDATDYEGEDDTEFNFTITLEGDASLVGGMRIFDGIAFNDGVAHVALKDDESLSIDGLPEGVTYTVEEESRIGYEPVCFDDSGEIATSADSEVQFYNVVKKTQPETTAFSLEKKIEGTAGAAGEAYAFDVEMDGLQPLETYRVLDASGEEVLTYSATELGTADFQIELAADEKATFEGIPVGTRYRITEDGGDYRASYKVVDAADKAKVVSAAGSNMGTDQPLSTALETADEGEDVTVTFTNRVYKTADLRLAKRVDGSGSSDVFKFDVEFEGMQEGDSFNSSAGRIVADEAGKASLTVLLADGDVVDFTGVPVGARYRFTEQESDAIASFTAVDVSDLGKIDTTSDENDTGHMPLPTALETVDDGEQVTVTFVNTTYSDIAVATPGVVKTVVDQGGNAVETDDEFTFTLTAATRTLPMPEGSSKGIKTVTASGADADNLGKVTADFGEITFDVPGTYVYTIAEVEGDDAGMPNATYEYDATIYTVTYVVSKNEDGTFELSSSVEKDGGESDAYAASLPFTNVKTTYVDVEGTKTWNDADDQDGTRPASVTVRLHADGVEVDSADVTEDGGWTYFFEHLPQYTEDGHEIVYTITEDAVADYVAKVDGFDVVNSHEPGKTSVPVSKVWNDGENADEIRPGSVTVELFANGAPAEKVLVLTAEGGWTGMFTELDMYTDGEPVEYTVSEVDVEGYDSEVSGDATKGFVVTNTHEPQTPPSPEPPSPEPPTPEPPTPEPPTPEPPTPEPPAPSPDETVPPQVVTPKTADTLPLAALSLGICAATALAAFAAMRLRRRDDATAPAGKHARM